MWRSFSKAAFVRALQRLVPEISADDLETAPAGIRAQAVLSNGKLVDDFLIQENKTSLMSVMHHHLQQLLLSILANTL